jgi:hypothetical protein
MLDKNKVNHYVRMAFVMDTLRVWPRIFITAYFVGGAFVLHTWLTTATTWSQDGFATIYSGLCVPLLKWYMENGTDYNHFIPLWFKGYVPLPGEANEHVDGEHKKD